MNVADAPTVLRPGGTNAVGRMLGLLGDEWTLLIMQQALLGATRYADFIARLPISNSVLAARLRTLTTEGLLERNVYQSNPLRAEYLVTPRSRSLWPLLLSIWEWERHWVPAHAETLPSMHHATCDGDFVPALVCRSCGAGADAKDVLAQWGPSGSWQRSVPAASTRRRSESAPQSNQAGLFPDTMSIFGNRWAAALLVAAFVGTTRFNEFQSALGAPPSLIADRLQVFCAFGVLVARQNAARPDWAAYHLTEKGRAFFPVLLRHSACGEPFVGVLTCDQCAEPLVGADVQVCPRGVSEGGLEPPRPLIGH
jgi:DNA-binding HxlR family transcriptional regulator